MAKIKPLSDRVVLKQVSLEEKTKSGIILPETAEKEKPEQGEVIAVGPGRLLKDGARAKMEIKKGDKVLFSRYSPTEVKINGKEYLVVKEEDILAILE
ncbi:co-chaperone GroES [Patescibacteria group bacterium]|nr:co-chaperone GroES [Patescibacteria group bacterium]MBU4057024.1 co-chaperone GroES [Patescibacteria group bacterium]MBU4368259.1 co-chaperone GroES [Patescibacteria group bacterium]